MSDRSEEVRKYIRETYAGVAQGARPSCCGGGCGCGVQETSAMLGYDEGDLASVPEASNMGLGCGNPVAIAALKAGETVLDLGSGGGFDCFLARKQVGESGQVIGVDMTPDMIALARKNAAEMNYTNVDFRLGEIEHMPVADGTVDAIISNCVINLSLDKEQVFSEMFRVLKPGGRISTSDVVAIADIPQGLRDDFGMIASCIGGAEHVDNIKAMLLKVGFINIRLYPKDNSAEIVNSWLPEGGLDSYIASYIMEAEKSACGCAGGCCG